MLSNNIKKLNPSPTLELNAKAKEMLEKGIDVINLSAGELDFKTPLTICNAGKEAIDQGQTKYTCPSGTLQLKEAVLKKFKTDNKLNYKKEEVIICNGAKQALFNAFFVLCNTGDEVLVFAPTWSTYIEQIKLAGAKPKIVDLKKPFKLTAEIVKKNLTGKTKIVLINSPANPTGAIIEKPEIKKIAKLLENKKIWIISDEVYEKLSINKKHLSIACVNQKIKEKTITINGISKSHAMTGWRIGFAGGHKKIIKAMSNLQAQTTSNPCSISQAAAIEALKKENNFYFKAQRELEIRRNFVQNKLKEIPCLDFSKPEGGFYFFIKLNQKNSLAWSKRLLEKEKVVVVPGEAFYKKGYFRISFAVSLETLEKGLKRIKRFVQKAPIS
ncbi:MAG: aminotransferase class I/II-fold pyridoxal phosphate-dependent enzyme [Candidatus Moranbacteria bacterium]|nr:aminotransferase class I/II-fold pyridoxal phosphate-dependent enzyme [Candidatus Moranbacteria bacterium]